MKFKAKNGSYGHANLLILFVAREGADVYGHLNTERSTQDRVGEIDRTRKTIEPRIG